jgi:hypothetical protein
MLDLPQACDRNACCTRKLCLSPDSRSRICRMRSPMCFITHYNKWVSLVVLP